MGITIGLTGCSSTLAQVVMDHFSQRDDIDLVKGLDVKKPSYESDKLRFYQGDVRDHDIVEKCLDGCDIVIHMAFVVYGKPGNEEEYEDINIYGSKNVFRIATQLGIKKIIHISSAAAYGFHKDRIVDQHWLKEEDELKGQDFNFYYFHDKGLVEQFLEKHHHAHPDVTITTIRPATIAGPHYNDQVFLRTFREGMANSSLTMIKAKNSSKPLWQLVHEEDVAKLIMYCIDHDISGAINIAGDPVDIKEHLNQYNIKVNRTPYWLANILMRPMVWFGKIDPIEANWLKALEYDIILDNSKASELIGDITDTGEILDELYEYVTA